MSEAELVQVVSLTHVLQDGVSYGPGEVIEMPRGRAKRLVGKKAVRPADPDDLVDDEEPLTDAEQETLRKALKAARSNPTAEGKKGQQGNQQAVTAPTQGAK